MSKRGLTRQKRDHEVSIENRRARFDYTITETLETGIQLWGSEVKSVREGQVSLAEGYVRVESDPPALYLHGINIGEYGPAGPRQHSPTRTRKLLAHKREIMKLWKESQVKGVTIVPLKIYFKNGWAKVLVGLGTGKGRRDKRQDIQKRETDRTIRRVMSKRM